MQTMEAGAGVDIEIPPFVLAGIRIEIGDGAALLSRLPRTTTADLRIHCRRMRRSWRGAYNSGEHAKKSACSAGSGLRGKFLAIKDQPLAAQTKKSCRDACTVIPAFAGMTK